MTLQNAKCSNLFSLFDAELNFEINFELIETDRERERESRINVVEYIVFKYVLSPFDWTIGLTKRLIYSAQ